MTLIEFKDLPDTSTPLNAENLNHNFNELNEGNAFSLEEKEIGTWIDGKPLYRRTFVISKPDATEVKQQHSINAEEVWINESASFLKANWDEVRKSLNYYENANNYIRSEVTIPSSGTVQISIYSADALGGYYFGTCYVTLNYTKTTD